MANPMPTKRLKGTAGNVGLPGAPILYFDLLYNTSTGALSGHACIVSASPPPFGHIVISNVTGKVLTSIFGGTISHVVTLQGTYQQPLPAGPIIIEQSFAAYFLLGSNFDGRGSFEFGGTLVKDVPVTCTSSHATTQPESSLTVQVSIPIVNGMGSTTLGPYPTLDEVISGTFTITAPSGGTWDITATDENGAQVFHIQNAVQGTTYPFGPYQSGLSTTVTIKAQWSMPSNTTLTATVTLNF